MSRSLKIDTESLNRGSGLEVNAESFSPNSSPQSPSERYRNLKDEEHFGFERQESSDSGDINAPLDEAHEYDTESRSGESGTSKSRRSIERDAFRKYVRKRYMNRNSKAI